jgi:acyl-coenzyme A thioesterase PaaI-like protein
MPIRKIAHRLTNLVEFGLHGEPPLNSVYQPFKRADAALEGLAPEHESYQQLLATQQLALSALTGHPVNVSQNANLYVTDASRSNHRLEDFSGAEQDQITGAIRGRFTDITPELVVDLLRAEEEHKNFLWSPTRAISASVRSTRDLAARSLTTGSWGVEHLTSTDDTAAADYAQLAHGYQMALAEDDMSDSDKERLERLQSEFKVSMSEFIAAKQKVAKVVSGVASTAIATIITAVTAGAGAPVAAALLTTALSGGASIAIHEGILGDDYDAQEAGAELAVELLKTALTAHMDKFWTLGKAGIQQALLESVTGRQLLASKAALEAVGNRTLGEFGMSLAGTAVDTATGDLSDVAWKMLDPSMYQHGFDHAMSDGLSEFEAALKGLGPNVLKAMLAECAKEAGKRAVADRPSTAGPNARSLGAQLPEAPDPDTEPKAFLEYLKKQLAGVPNAMWDEAVQTGVTGLVNTAVTEGEEFLLTGDDRIDVDRTIGVLSAAGTAALSTGGSSVVSGGVGAYRDYQGAHEAHERAPQHQQRMKLIDELSPELSPTERELLRAWSRDNAFEPIGPDLEDLEDGDAEADARVARAQALQDVETFRKDVLQPIEQQLDRHSTTWGEDHSEADRESYREWVMASPTGIDSRLAVTPNQYIARRRTTITQVQQAKDSAGYRSLSAVQRAWFDHAAAHPTAIADLTKDTVTLQIQVSTTEQADAFQRQLQAIQADVASQALTELLPTLSEDQRQWAEANAATLTRGLAMSPSNTGQNSDMVRTRTLRRYQDVQDAAVVSRVSGG